MVKGTKEQRRNQKRVVRMRAATRVVIGCAVGIILFSYWIHGWWVSPEHRVAQFVAASTRLRYQDMLNLSDPPEIRRAQLSAERFRHLLIELVGRNTDVEFDEPVAETLNARQARFNYMVSVSVRTADNRPLLDPDGRPVRAYLHAYNTDRGWKIALTHFAFATFVASHPEGRNLSARFATACRNAGVEPGFLEPTSGEWREVMHPG